MSARAKKGKFSNSASSPKTALTEKKIANIPKATAAEKAAGRNLFAAGFGQHNGKGRRLRRAGKIGHKKPCNIFAVGRAGRQDVQHIEFRYHGENYDGRRNKPNDEYYTGRSGNGFYSLIGGIDRGNYKKQRKEQGALVGACG